MKSLIFNSSMKYPKRHITHTLEELSHIFLIKHLPTDWNVNKLDKDYGQDINIEIAEDGELRGLDLIVQLKSSKESTKKAFETIRLKVSTFNYLWDNLRVVMLIKYVQYEDEAYWSYLKDVSSPNQENDTFIVRIPKENKISKLDWEKIKDFVRMVTTEKLEVRRPRRKL